MSTLTSAMQTALNAAAPLVFAAVEILLPGGAAVRLLDGGSTALTFASKTFVDVDATYGSLGGVSQYSDGVDNQAPSVAITLLTPGTGGTAALADPAAQGSAVTVWIGCLTGGAVVADPAIVFAGVLDVATLKIGQNARSLELTVVSVFDRFFMQDEGVRLNNGSHKQFWAGELGCQYVETLQPDLPWGAAVPRPVLAIAA